MHKIHAAENQTTLYRRAQQKYSYYSDYEKILSIPKLVELNIQDNVLQIEKMMDKLRMLVVFS